MYKKNNTKAPTNKKNKIPAEPGFCSLEFISSAYVY